MWHIFEADSANELWISTVGALRTDQGVHTQASRAGGTREILHAALTLRNPRDRWITARRPAMNPAFAVAEVFWILGGRRDAKFLTYFNRSLHQHAGSAPCLHGAYGYRLRRHFEVDQLQRAFEALRENPDSRQVVLQIWDPAADLPLADGKPRDSDIPCNTQSILKVREGRLEWLQIMRSNDVFLGLPHNLVQFTFLQEILAGWLEMQVGEYHHVSDSLHLYDRDEASIQSGPVGLFESGDTYGLPKAESDGIIATVIKAVEFMIDERHTADHLVQLPTTMPLPKPYENLVRVMLSEALRRRDAVHEAEGMIAGCSNLALVRMWSNWMDRIRSQSK